VWPSPASEKLRHAVARGGGARCIVAGKRKKACWLAARSMQDTLDSHPRTNAVSCTLARRDEDVCNGCTQGQIGKGGVRSGFDPPGD